MRCSLPGYTKEAVAHVDDILVARREHKTRRSELAVRGFFFSVEAAALSSCRRKKLSFSATSRPGTPRNRHLAASTAIDRHNAGTASVEE